ncbi:beta-glucosidase [Lentinula raphanica]|nr:beta-glucosidase [Lentinula raphanica]
MFFLTAGSLSLFFLIVNAQQSVYQQCGGIGWSGGTTCASGSTCTVINPYYSQCLPGSTSVPSSTSTSLSSTSSSTATSTGTSVPSSTPPANLSPGWATAYTKAQAAVAKLSLSDKVNLGSGVGWMKGNCVGNTPAISSISFPGLCLEDSPLGVRYADFVSAFPPAINVAATFNRTLMRQRGEAMGQEFRGKGVNVALGPMMNLMRAPAAGRNWEGFGGDPYLSGEGAYETIMGVQSTGVQATAKHYINNEQEHSRTTSSSEPDDRFEHELYAIPFLRSVQANVASVMCSYINGSFACENDKTLNGILKGEFAFPGCMYTHWGATHSTAPAVNAGLDMTMPGDMGALGAGGNWFGQNLVDAVNSGSVSEARVTDLATRVLAAWYLVGQDSGYPAVNFDAWNLDTPVNTHVNVQADHRDLILEIDRASTVLLKNTGTLPLNKPSTLAIVGNGAFNSSMGPNGYSDRSGDDGVLAMGWGSGTDNFPYLIAPIDAITSRASTEGTVISSSSSDTDLNAAAAAATGKDVAFVFITADSGEGYLTVEGNEGDRNDLSAWHSGDALVTEVAGVNSNTVVVVNSVGPIIMESWIENANVTAVVWSGLPGQEAGNGLVDIIYGDYNPSGRLPFTIGKETTDYSAQVIYEDAPDSDILPIPYSEGIFIDYRHFDAANITPRFEFGFGLSYTTFAYSDISVSGSTTSSSGAPTGSGAILNSWFHDAVVNVTFTLENNGTVAGNEVPQLYITLPSSAGAAPKNLKGFDSIFLEPGQSTTVTMSLSRFDFSVWDVVSQQWIIPSGTSTISIGSSSRDIHLTHTIANQEEARRGC